MEHTCEEKGTIGESLRRHTRFKKLMEKKPKNKQGIIIERPNMGYVVAHFPCSTIKDETLRIYTVHGQTMDSVQFKKSNDLITFTIENKCDPLSEIKTLLKPSFQNFNPICVYGYEKEKVLTALKRDGRFKSIFDRITQLTSKTNTGSDDSVLELDENLMCERVKGRRFQCRIYEEYRDGSDNHKLKKAQPKRKRNDSVPRKKSENKPESTSAQPPCIKTSDNCEKPHYLPHPVQSRYKIPDAEELLGILRDQFETLLDTLRRRESGKTDIELLKEEFLKCSEGFTITAMENMMNLASSVCIVQAGEMSGTGFLLFSEYILTNAHVIQNIYNETNQTLRSDVNVYFDFKNYDPNHDRKKYVIKKEVLAYKYGIDNFKRCTDFAVLQLVEKPTGLKPIIHQYISPRSNTRGICMIGHPEGGVKKLDISVMIIHEEREEAFQGVLCLTWSPETMRYQIQRGADIVTYDTCFGSGSSGSPVFDSECRLIALHTGTLHCGNQKCVMEFAIPMKSILENIILIFSEKELVDPLVSLIIDAKDNEDVKSCYNSFVDEVKRNYSENQSPSLQSLLNTINKVDEQIRDRESHSMETGE